MRCEHRHTRIENRGPRRLTRCTTCGEVIKVEARPINIRPVLVRCLPQPWSAEATR